MKKPNSAARITSLRNYISLLNQEEKRLKWVLASTTPPNPERADAAKDATVISAKLHKAERELSDLELR